VSSADLQITLVDDAQAADLIDERLQAVAEAAIAGEDLGPAHLTLRLVDPGISSDLHEAHFGDNSPTDVMAFPDGSIDPDNGRRHIGDLAVCPQLARDRCAGTSAAVADEVLLYALHGLLHCLGFDDHDPEDRADMWQRQDELLKPYSITVIDRLEPGP
jgi:probable rRNA maturation factor